MNWRSIEYEGEDANIIWNYDITKRKRAEEALREKTQFLELNQVITAPANEATKVEDTMQTALDQVCAHTGWPVGHVYILADDDTGELIPTNIWHLDDAQRFEVFRRVTDETRFAPGVGLPGRVLASGKPAWIPDVGMASVKWLSRIVVTDRGNYVITHVQPIEVEVQ